jgi:predicted TIM-barrel fold metal-dependent hydrolase
MAQLPPSGVIDADGHVLEPADLWEHYLGPGERDRGVHLRVNANGLEYLEIDGAPLSLLSPGALGMLGAMGDDGAAMGPDRRYMEVMPPGACDPKARVAWLDDNGLDAAVLYPTLGIIWEAAVPDAVLATALARAYNRWLADFCRDSRGRLVGVAHLCLADVDLAVAELERAVGDGLRGAFFAPFTWTRVPQGDPYYDPLWAAAERLGVPVGIHPSYEPEWADTLERFPRMGRPGTYGAAGQFMRNLAAREGVQQAFASFFAYGTLDRFPGLRLGVLESGAGWIGSFLDRLDTLMADTMLRSITPLATPPSECFARQCWISCDPDERAAPLIVDHVGAGSFVWATDYPHPDHPATWRASLGRFVEPLSATATERVLGANAAALYRLSSGSGAERTERA